MPNPDEELPDDFDEESDEDVTDEEDYEIDEEDDDASPPARRSASGQLRAALDDATAEVADLKHRLGEQARVSGERLKQRDEEISDWLERVQEWHANEVQVVRQEAFAEGVSTVERRLLPLLATEEKAEYLEAVRTTPQSVSPRSVQRLDTTRKVATPVRDSDIEVQVTAYTKLGVPLDQLDQTSAQSVVESGSTYLANRTKELEERVAGIEGKLEGRMRETSGAARVSSGAGSSRPAQSSLAKELEQVERDIAKAKRNRNIGEGTRLLKRKKEIEARLARRRAA